MPGNVDLAMPASGFTPAPEAGSGCRQVRRFHAGQGVLRVAADIGTVLEWEALNAAVERYDTWQGSDDAWAGACARIAAVAAGGAA